VGVRKAGRQAVAPSLEKQGKGSNPGTGYQFGSSIKV